jgi:hypothetical protein
VDDIGKSVNLNQMKNNNRDNGCLILVILTLLFIGFLLGRGCHFFSDKKKTPVIRTETPYPPTNNGFSSPAPQNEEEQPTKKSFENEPDLYTKKCPSRRCEGKAVSAGRQCANMTTNCNGFCHKHQYQAE